MKNKRKKYKRRSLSNKDKKIKNLKLKKINELYNEKPKEPSLREKMLHKTKEND
jgi:hypothetical protein